MPRTRSTMAAIKRPLPRRWGSGSNPAKDCNPIPPNEGPSGSLSGSSVSSSASGSTMLREGELAVLSSARVLLSFVLGTDFSARTGVAKTESKFFTGAGGGVVTVVGFDNVEAPVLSSAFFSGVLGGTGFCSATGGLLAARGVVFSVGVDGVSAGFGAAAAAAGVGVATGGAGIETAGAARAGTVAAGVDAAAAGTGAVGAGGTMTADGGVRAGADVTGGAAAVVGASEVAA